MARFSIRYKLLVSFIGIAMLSLPFNLYIMAKLSTITKHFLVLTDTQLPNLRALLEMKTAALRIGLFISNFNFSVEQANNNPQKSSQLDSTKDQLLAYLEELGAWQKTFQDHQRNNEESQALVKKLTALREDVILQALDVFSSIEKRASKEIVNKQMAELELSQSMLESFINNAVNIESDAVDLNKSNVSNAWLLLVALLVGSTLFILFAAFAIGFFLSRWISRPIINLRDFTSRINQNNLLEHTPILTKDEIGDLAKSINTMLDNLASAKTQIIEVSRSAGVAEVATSVIHNVGNILNSVITSVTMLKELSSKSKINSLPKLYNVLNDNKENLTEFLNHNERGQLVLPYLHDLNEVLQNEHQHLSNEIKTLQENLDQINQVITMQLSSESVLGVVEAIHLNEIIELTLKLQENKILTHEIQIIRHLDKLQPLITVKSKLQQILVNLFKNAVEALLAGECKDKTLSIRLKTTENDVIQLEIQDNGIGILKENLDKIFAFGFTTKNEGHGFGLHSCALLAHELGGDLTVHSEGLQQGATFILTLRNLKEN